MRGRMLNGRRSYRLSLSPRLKGPIELQWSRSCGTGNIRGCVAALAAITGTRWDAATWPTAKVALGWALAERDGCGGARGSIERPMLLRLTLFLGLLLVNLPGCSWPRSDIGSTQAETPVPDETPDPKTPVVVDTEDAYATQCRAGICATLQVTRSRFSHGGISTLLFFSAYDKGGAPIAIPGFPAGFTAIESEHFVMNPKGTKATLNYSGVSVTWEANDSGRRKTKDGQALSATIKGEVGPIVFNSAAPRGPGDSGSAFLTLRKTMSSDTERSPRRPRVK